jgi:hypothetical protein
MTKTTVISGGWQGQGLRVAIWGVATLALMLPWVAMQFTAEVAWSLGDFVVFGALLAGACCSYELAVRATRHPAYRAGAGLAILAAFLLVWLSLGVGIIGKDGDLANLMYFGVLAVGIIGAFIAGFRPLGMARALLATALAQALVALIAWVAGLGLPWSGPAEILLLNGFFIALFGASAWLFWRAARGQALPGAGFGQPGQAQ